MKAVIARYYNILKKAEKHADEMRKMWKGKIAWYVVCASNGYFVISETSARLCFPHLTFSYKDRRYKK